MTIYGTPGSTPANMNPFQGTQPGSPVGPTLQVVNPGVGLFPPNSNNNSGDTIMASVSRGACPANVNVTNLGITAASGLGTGAAGGRAVLETIGTAQAKGANSSFTSVLGGSANMGPAGDGSLGAGGYNQTNSPGAGTASILPANAPVTVPTIPAAPVYVG